MVCHLYKFELKKTVVKISKKPLNQINRYKIHSYCNLFRFIQIFVISNGVDTKYYANSDYNPLYSLTFFWTDEHNKRITKLADFAQRLFKS